MKIRRPINRRFVIFEAVLLTLVVLLTGVGTRLRADSAVCNGQNIELPFTDVMGNSFFCFIAQLYFQGISSGTSASTYSPAANVTREQMAAFLSRTQNSVLNRGSRRAALNQFWTTTPQYTISQGAGQLGTTPVGFNPELVASDGTDLWVANNTSGTVSRVRASDGKLLETWTGADGAVGVLCAMGRVFVTGQTRPGKLYVIDPTQPAGPVTVLSNALGLDPEGIAFDGRRIWTANNGSVSIITPGAPFTVTNVGGFNDLDGIVYDGANIWVTEVSFGSLRMLNTNGEISESFQVGNSPRFPIFDGTNIWVPNLDSNSVSVMRRSDGRLATLTGNGLNQPFAAAFDGQRILITNFGGHSVSLFRATDFAPLGSFSTGANSVPRGVCSDGVNFWITLLGPNRLARF